MKQHPYTLCLLALLLSGSALSQVPTIIGLGDERNGTFFSVGLDGTNEELLHVFNSNPKNPAHTRLLYANDKIWGISRGGGQTGGGTIFNVNLNGKDLEIIHEFEQATGSGPQGALLEIGNKFWGVAGSKGNGDEEGYGVIYTIDNDGTNYTVVHNFTNVENGRSPVSHLSLIDEKVWGMTRYGGPTNHGTVFTIDTDGSNFIEVHQFDETNGSTPTSNQLIEHQGKVWGTTSLGGTNGDGVIFSIDTDGSNFSVVHNFIQLPTGAHPVGGLVFENGRLWGTTSEGGLEDRGTIFSLASDGTDFSKHYEFRQSTGHLSPESALFPYQGKLYGITRGGGSATGNVFSIDNDGSNYQSLRGFTAETGHRPSSDFINIDGELWSVSNSGGGISSGGTVYKFLPSSNTIQKVVSLAWPPKFGANPTRHITRALGKIWLTTLDGGLYDEGTIVSYDLATKEVQKIHDFNRETGYSSGQLVFEGTKAYGMCFYKEGTYGTFYSINADGSGFESLYDFPNSETKPLSNLQLINGKIYGSNSNGLFTINTDGSNYTQISDQVAGELTLVDGKLWGVSSSYIYRIDLTGENYTIMGSFGSAHGAGKSGAVVHENRLYWYTKNGSLVTMNFDGSDLKEIANILYISHTLISHDGKLWGLIYQDGEPDQVFTINGDGSDYTVVHNFTFDAAEPPRASYFNGAMMILPAKQTQDVSITLGKTSGTYGDQPIEITIASSTENEISLSSSNEDVGTVATDQLNIVGAGQATVSAHQEESETHFASFDSQQIIIEKASLSVSPDDLTIAYGMAVPSPTASIAGFVGSDGIDDLDVLPQASTEATNTSDVGEYKIELFGGEDQNYSFNYGEGIVTIEKALLTVRAPSLEKEYGESPEEVTVEYEGFVNDDTASDLDIAPQVSNEVNSSSPVGLYPITIGGGSDNNYGYEYIDGDYSVAKSSLTATADNKVQTFGAIDVNLTISYEGFVLGEDESVIGSPSIISTDVNGNSDAGTYEIVLSGGTDDNYHITEVNGVFTVEKADQTISFQAISDDLNDESAPIQLMATATSGLAVDFATNDATVATVEEGQLAIQSSGVVDISALQSGSNNYNPAETVTQTLTIDKVLSAIRSNKIEAFPNPATENFALRFSSKFDFIYLINLHGKAVKKYKYGVDQSYNLSTVKNGTYLILSETGGVLMPLTKLSVVGKR